MSIKYGPYIKSLRNERGFSQSLVAERLGLSRQSYVAVENGERELTVNEVTILADLLGVSIEELLMTETSNYEKYKQMILVYLRLPISRDGRVPKTKLAKLVYLADFAWFYDHLESMSGMQYIRRSYGPVPDPYFRAISELEEEGKINIDYKGDAILIGEGEKKQESDLLSKNEISLMLEIAKKWKDKRTQEIVDFTHNQLPYKICLPNEVIPYELITQEDPENVY